MYIIFPQKKLSGHIWVGKILQPLDIIIFSQISLKIDENLNY
jgi:hypothetical protein